jgi:ribosomal protein L11 methylase PrmA
MSQRILVAACAALLVGSCAQPNDAQSQTGSPEPERQPDVVYVPTPDSVVDEMLQLAEVGPQDVVYDLGCGDGRIAIAAVRDFAARKAVCIDIDPERVREARDNVRRAGLEDRIEVREGDLFEADISDATVVTLYLLDSLNLKLRPRLLEQLPAGARVVSQTFDMGDWEPQVATAVDGKDVYLWTIPEERTAVMSR